MLDRKEQLLVHLRTMNDEAEAGLHVGAMGRHTEAFQATYAQTVLELKQVRMHSSPCVKLTQACRHSAHPTAWKSTQSHSVQ